MAIATWPSWQRVSLKPFSEGLTEDEWLSFYHCFKDAEISRWNGSKPLRMPFWLFKQIVKTEIHRRDRIGFGILDENKAWIGTIELYEIGDKQATLGILISNKAKWSGGYGREAIAALLRHGFAHMGLRKVKLKTFIHNHRAQRCFEKAGFKQLSVDPSPPRLLWFLNKPRFYHYEIAAEQWEGYPSMA